MDDVVDKRRAVMTTMVVRSVSSVAGTNGGAVVVVVVVVVVAVVVVPPPSFVYRDRTPCGRGRLEESTVSSLRKEQRGTTEATRTKVLVVRRMVLTGTASGDTATSIASIAGLGGTAFAFDERSSPCRKDEVLMDVRI
jgi:hypothetical protein